MIKKICFLIITSISILFSQSIQSPLDKSNFSKLTSHEELKQFIKEIDEQSDLIKSEVLTNSVEGRELYVVYFSKGEFGKDENKIKILIFAQQHGNEQSGKEGSMLLIQELIKPENQYLFDKIDFAIVPQMNPDGSEKNQRRNGNGMDLNRNHLILTEPETIALHKLFAQYQFEVTMDVHEYWPFGEEWKKLGFRKNFDETIGAVTNINVSKDIKELSYKTYLHFIFNYLSEKGFTAFHYLPGGPPEIDYIRYSTYDINDGRQSFGIQNTLSFIQEGMNGENYSTDNIEHRAKGQMTGMFGLLKFSYDNKDEIKKMIANERENLIENKINDKVAIQLDHFSDGSKLEMPIFSYYSEKDTIITVNDFRPVVKSLFDVERPIGYLFKKELTEVKTWADNHNIKYYNWKNDASEKLQEYFIDSIGTIDFERDTVINPFLETLDVTKKINPDEYYFIPVKQLQNNLIVIALEPKSILGLVTYKQFAHLLKTGEKFPILRVVK